MQAGSNSPKEIDRALTAVEILADDTLCIEYSSIDQRIASAIDQAIFFRRTSGTDCTLYKTSLRLLDHYLKRNDDE